MWTILTFSDNIMHFWFLLVRTLDRYGSTENLNELKTGHYSVACRQNICLLTFNFGKSARASGTGLFTQKCLQFSVSNKLLHDRIILFCTTFVSIYSTHVDVNHLRYYYSWSHSHNHNGYILSADWKETSSILIKQFDLIIDNNLRFTWFDRNW